jgi:SAM-dependent methyltransferase
MDERDNWDRHWSNYDSIARSNPAQAFRRELLIHWLKKQDPGPRSRLLDIGSGQGDLIADLVQTFPYLELAGVEMSATGIAQSSAKSPQALFFQRDLSLSPNPGDDLLEWASLAVCCEVLEHVDHPDKVLAHATRYLAPGARLFITVPGGPISAFDRHIGHRQHFTKASLDRLVRNADLIPEKITGMGFPFFNLYRMIVILRGKALIKDASPENERDLNFPGKLAMSLFSLVLKCKLNSTFWGWQMTAQAKKPE